MFLLITHNRTYLFISFVCELNYLLYVRVKFFPHRIFDGSPLYDLLKPTLTKLFFFIIVVRNITCADPDKAL